VLKEVCTRCYIRRMAQGVHHNPPHVYARHMRPEEIQSAFSSFWDYRTYFVKGYDFISRILGNRDDE
jgi:hypothetical protein